MALISAFFTSSFGTVIVSTPFSMLALTSSVLVFSGNLNLQRNFTLLLSMRCHLSFFSSYSLLLSPLIWRSLLFSTSTFTSSFFTSGRLALKRWAFGVSFQSIWLLVKAEVSPTMLGMLKREVLNRKPSKGSQRSSTSKMLLHRPPPRTLGMSDIFYKCWIDLLSWTNNFLMIKLMERTCYILDVIENYGTFLTFPRYFLFGWELDISTIFYHLPSSTYTFSTRP